MIYLKTDFIDKYSQIPYHNKRSELIDKLKCIKLTDQTIRRGSWRITTESEYCLSAGSIFAATSTQILNTAGSTSVIMLCLVNSDFLEY